MQKLILTILMVLLCAPAWGATYYVSPSGDGTDGSTWSHAHITIQSALAAHTAAGTVIELDGGVGGISYTENIDSVAAGITIQGSAEAGRSGQVSIVNTGLGDHTVNVTHHLTALKRVRISGSTGTNYNLNINSGGIDLVKNVQLDGGTRHLFYNVGSGTITFNNVTFKNSTDTTWMAYLQASSQNIKFINCFSTNNTGDLGIPIGTVAFNGFVCNGNPGRCIYQPSGTPTITVTNSIFIGSGSRTGEVLKGSAISVSNSILLPSPSNTLASWPSITVGSGVLYDSPLFRAQRYPAVFVLGIDDTANIDHWASVSAIANSYGYPMGIAVNAANSSQLTSEQVASLKSRLTAGNEVYGHTTSHSDLTTLYPFTITHVSATATITVNQSDVSTANWTGSLSLSTGETFDLKNTSYNTIAKLCTAIGNVSGYTCTLNSNISANAAYIYPVALAAVTNQSLAGGYQVLFNRAAWLKMEVSDNKALLESVLGSSLSTFVYPQNYEDATVRAAVLSAGYVGGRVGTSGQNDLSNIDVFKFYGIQASSTPIGTTVNLQRNVKALVEWARSTGRVVHIYDHTAALFSVQNWTDLFSALRDSGATVMTMSQAVDYIKANGTGSNPYTRTLVDQPNYRPTSTSQAIAAGSNDPWTGVSSAVDPDGKPITDAEGNVFSRWVGGTEKSTVDIGAYQYPSDALTISADGAKGGYFNAAHPYAWALPDSPSGYSILASGDQDRQFSLTMTGLQKGRIKVRLTDGVGAQLDSTIPIGVSGGSGGFRW